MSTGIAQGVGAELTIAPLTIEPDEIARFISECYDGHPHGKSFVPRWTGPFLKHVILDHPESTPDHALGAYVGDRLVGVMMAQPYDVHLDGERFRGAYGSQLAIVPDGAGPLAALKLIGEVKQRLRARGVEVMIGVAYRSGPGVGLDFWERFGRAFPGHISKGQDLKFWARILDGRAFAGAVGDPLLKLGGHASRAIPVREPRHNPHIRPFASGDLERCQTLLADAPARIRTAPTLWHLQSAPNLSVGPETLVLDRGSGPEALSLFHILPMTDAGPLGVGLIEHLVGGTESDRHRLLAATLWRLKQAGACLALVPRKPHLSTARMLLGLFAPYAAEFQMFLLPCSDRVVAEMPASFDLMVR